MLARIRLTAFSIFLIFYVALMGIACLPVILFGREASRRTVKLWAKMGLFFLKLITGISYRVEGAENIPQGGAVIAANHQSMWETMALYAIAPKPVIVLKKELASIPVYGWWAKAAGNIIVDRKGAAKALRALARDAKASIESGAQIIIFPEGTRLAAGTIAPFQPGVAGIYTAAQAPCVPAAHDSGCFWRHRDGEMVPGTITLRFLTAIPPNLDRKKFLAELKRVIEAARPDLENIKVGEVATHD